MDYRIHWKSDRIDLRSDYLCTQYHTKCQMDGDIRFTQGFTRKEGYISRWLILTIDLLELDIPPHLP